MLFDSNNKVTPLWNFYPELFKEEKELHEKEQQELEWKLWKAKFEAFAQTHNNKRGGD